MTPYYLEHPFYYPWAGDMHKTNASPSVKERRQKLFELSNGKLSQREADAIILYFGDYYKGPHFNGLTKRERLKLYEEKKGLCFVCGEHLTYGEATVEHIIPQAECIAKGVDPNVWENYAISHIKCNADRTNKFNSMKYEKTGSRCDDADQIVVDECSQKDMCLGD